MEQPTTAGPLFTGYQKFIIAVLAFIQFTVVLDFMVLSPLSAILLDELHITTTQFGLVVSAYAFSAGASGIIAAGFADKFDRKKLLMFFYAGFVIGTLLCGLAPDYYSLLAARIVTGIFGGVIGSLSFAIITDLFKMEVRGRVMGFVQMAFASSQVLGLPIGLYLANHLGWHSPFWMIVGVSVLAGIAILIYMKPVDAHLKIQSDHNAFQHLIKTISNPLYLKTFGATVLLATGGFMLMPFGAAFSTNNLGVTLDQLPLIYMITGICSMVAGPFAGKLADKVGRYKVFVGGTLLSCLMVLTYTNLGVTPLWILIVINCVMFVGISSRMISASTLMTAIPSPQDRGAFMGINTSVSQMSGGVAAAAAGMIVVQNENGMMEHYATLGFVVVGTMLITVFIMYFLDQLIKKLPASNKQPIQKS